jgi:transposase
MPGRTFTREFKLEVVRQLANGIKRPAQLCREHHLSDSLLARWRHEYAERGEAAFTPRSGDRSMGRARRCHYQRHLARS